VCATERINSIKVFSYYVKLYIVDSIDIMLYNTIMKSIMIRNVPEDLHREFKILCVKKEVSINEQLLNLMRKEVEKEQKKKV